MAATTDTSRRSFETFRRAHGGSNRGQDSSETNVRIPFHGSCSRCHHFHINHPFTFSVDSTVHTRLFCERCNHPMFGLGRVSTQNTLASVESISTFTPRVCVDRLRQQQQQQQQQQLQQQPALQVETAPSTPVLGPLTTITERRSSAPSRSTSNLRTPAPTLSAASLAGEEAGGNNRREESVESRASLKSTAQEGPEKQALSPQTATLRRLRMIGRRFKKRFQTKAKDWKLPRIALQIPSTPRVGMTDHPSASPSTAEVPSGQAQSDNAEQLVIGTGDDAEDRHASLRARRRESTLAREREFALPTKCECSPECPCISGSRVVQVDRAETPENISVPRYLFSPYHSSTGSSNSQPSQNSAQGVDPLLHIGGHFDSPRRSSSADGSSSAADSGSRPIRLSQGSTLWSNGSSVSLRDRRPPFHRASSMPVGSRTQYLTSVRTGSQTTSSNLGPGGSEDVRAPTSLDGRNMPRRTSHTELSRNHEASSQESSTSLANLPDPQEEDELVDGVSPTSHTPVRDGDEVTPTPHSGIRLDGDSNGLLPVSSGGLSSALQGLANRDRTDHEVQPPEFQANGTSD